MYRWHFYSTCLFFGVVVALDVLGGRQDTILRLPKLNPFLFVL